MRATKTPSFPRFIMKDWQMVNSVLLKLTIAFFAILLLSTGSANSSDEWRSISPKEAQALVDACDELRRLDPPFLVEFTTFVEVEPFGNPDQSLEFSHLAVMAERDGLIYRHVDRPVVTDGELRNETKQLLRVFDGDLAISDGEYKSNGNSIFHVSSFPKNARQFIAHPGSGLNTKTLVKHLTMLIEGNRIEGVSYEQRKSSSGETLIRIRRNEAAINAIFVSQGGKLMPKKVFGGSEADPTFSDEVVEYGMLHGVPFARRVIKTRADGVLGKTKLLIQADSVVEAENEIPASLFKLEIPKGAFIWDMDSEETIRDQSKIHERLDRMRAVGGN